MERTLFGHFVENRERGEEYLTLAFSSSSRPLKERWRNNGLSADFLSDYFTTFIPKDINQEKSKEIRAAVSYIANELLENAMKYSEVDMYVPISLSLDMDQDRLVFTLKNSISEEKQTRLCAFLAEFMGSDPEDFLLLQMEKKDNVKELSGLGFATMVNDYQARLAWCIEDTSVDGSTFSTRLLTMQVTLDV